MATPQVTPAEPVAANAGATAEQQPVEQNPVEQASQPVQQPEQDAEQKQFFEELGITDEPQAQEQPTEVPNVTPEFLNALQQRSQYIQSEADVERAAIAADNIWRTIDGQLSITDLFEALRSENPQAFQKMTGDALEYLSQISGRPIAQEAAGAAETPESKRIAALEAQLTEQRQMQESAAFSQRVNTVKQQVFLPAVAKAIEGTFLSGDQAFVVQQLGQKFQGKEMELIAQLERGNTSSLDKAIKDLQSEWRTRFNGWAKLIVSQRKQLAGAIPKVNGDGQSQRGEKAAGAEFDLGTKEGRLKYMESMSPGKA